MNISLFSIVSISCVIMKHSIEETQRSCFKEIKSSFTGLVNRLECQFKQNNQIYREKYLEVLDEIKKLNCVVNDCYQLFLQDKCTLEPISDNPISMLEYFRRLVGVILNFERTSQEEKSKIRNQTVEILNRVSTEEIFETLARKNLENYDLMEKVDDLSLKLQLSQEKTSLAEKELSILHAKYLENEQQSYTLLTTVVNLLKKAELNEQQLRQNNRLLKQLHQTHKIEFDRYKSNFKIPSTMHRKEKKIKQTLENKYQERQKIIIKQLSEYLERKYKKQKTHY